MFAIDAAKLVAGRKLGKALLMGKKYSPEILTIAGTVGVVASVVLIARATLKTQDIIQESKSEVNYYKNSDLPQKELDRELSRVYVKRTVDIVKVYTPGGILLIGSLAAMLGATGILKKRNVAAIAAYNALKSQYDSYRQNVIDTEGADKDREYRLGLRDEEVTNPETGEKHIVKKSDPSRYSRYAKIFDEGNANFNRSWREGNLTFLLAQQKYATQKLNAKGWLTLNEVYDALGLDETPDGAVVGWVLGEGDNYVDFGIFDLDSPAARDFVNGYEPNVILDFNVDGFIQDFIGRPRK